ncbi:MAG: hypothetical protein AAF500_14110 [Myxococcota bacterium]
MKRTPWLRALCTLVVCSGCGDGVTGSPTGGAGGAAGAGGALAGGAGGTGVAVGGAGSGGASAGGVGGSQGPQLVPFRFANMRSDARSLNVCLGAGEPVVFAGPVLETPLSPGQVEAQVEVRIATGSVLRWVAAGDCGEPDADSEDVSLDLEDLSKRHTAVVFGVGELETLIYETDPVSELSPGRFYVRFFHGVLDVEPLDSKQVDCATPVAAFENVEFGTLGFSPNNMATFFSASVSTGMDSFSTTVVLCENMNEIYRQDYSFMGGRSVSFFARGDGDGVPYQVTICDDADRGAARCEP